MQIVIGADHAGFELKERIRQDLTAAGHEVLAIDKVAPKEALPKGAKYWPVEFLNLGEVYQAIAGADYVCHIGAIPSPTGFPGATTFQNNTITQYLQIVSNQG